MSQELWHGISSPSPSPGGSPGEQIPVILAHKPAENRIQADSVFRSPQDRQYNKRPLMNSRIRTRSCFPSSAPANRSAVASLDATCFTSAQPGHLLLCCQMHCGLNQKRKTAVRRRRRRRFSSFCLAHHLSMRRSIPNRRPVRKSRARWEPFKPRCRG